MTWSLVLPQVFDDYDWHETELRGVLLNAELVHGEQRVPVIFSPERLAQAAAIEELDRPFYEPKVIAAQR